MRATGSTGAVTVRRGVPEDLDAVATLLTDVFLQDPLMSVIATAAPDPRAALDHLHRVELADRYLSPDPARREGAHVDLAVTSTPEGELLLGLTLWDAPGPGTDPSGPLGPGDALPEGLDLDVLGGAWELVLADGAQCEAARPQEPHWYLYMVAVTEQVRGTGTGTTLLRRGLERVDTEGAPAHLESTSPGSRRLYERHGFQVARELDDPRLPLYWAMTRPAAPGAGPAASPSAA